MSALPVIDLGRPAAEYDPATARSIGNALRDVGFFAVERHGIPRELIDQAYAAAREFFAQSDDVKASHARPDLFGQRGYTGFAVERALGANTADLKEFYQVGRGRGSSKYGGNVWPETPTEFRSTIATLYGALETLAMRIATACSLALDQPAEFLPSRIVDGESVLRIIHYPPLPDRIPEGAVRAAAHEDINFLTLLCGATADGLEIQTRDGRWHPVTAERDQIIVDSGDMLQNLTGGLFRSTTHRVVNSPGPAGSRLSMPFFVHPRADVDLTPLPGLAATAEGGRSFRSLTAGEFLHERLSAIRPTERKGNHVGTS